MKHLVTLVEKREAAQAEVDRLTAEITAALGDGATPWKVPGKRGRKPKALAETSDAPVLSKRGPKPRRPQMKTRGALKEFILAELQAAGKAGVSVKELSERLGVKPANVHVWVAQTGKKLGVKKIGRGQYAL